MVLAKMKTAKFKMMPKMNSGGSIILERLRALSSIHDGAFLQNKLSDFLQFLARLS